jgi:hypothetical protein
MYAKDTKEIRKQKKKKKKRNKNMKRAPGEPFRPSTRSQPTAHPGYLRIGTLSLPLASGAH